MGQAASKSGGVKSLSSGLVVTVDAFQTLFKFKEPIGKQYLDVARRCGLVDNNIQPLDVTAAFKACYKSHLLKFPNYGRGTLGSPEVWWDKLVTDTFTRLIGKEKIPEQLGRSLYNHFSGGNAYELFSDVEPFLQNLRRLRTQLRDIEGPALVTGVITNSDPRVSRVLQSLSLLVGDVQRSTLVQNAAALPHEMMKVERPQFRPPWHNAYSTNRDFDFVTTSYECGTQKPGSSIFRSAQKHASVVMLARASGNMEYGNATSAMKSMMKTVKLVSNSVDQVSQMQWIHIGDDLKEDYQGARAFGFESLLVDREGNHESMEGRIGGLGEASAVINLLVQEIVRSAA